MTIRYDPSNAQPDLLELATEHAFIAADLLVQVTKPRTATGRYRTAPATEVLIGRANAHASTGHLMLALHMAQLDAQRAAELNGDGRAVDHR